LSFNPPIFRNKHPGPDCHILEHRAVFMALAYIVIAPIATAFFELILAFILYIILQA